MTRVRHFLLAVEIPAVFALSLAAAVLALVAPPDFLSHASPVWHLAACAFFLAVAAYCAAMWRILLPSLPGHDARPAEEGNERQHDHDDCQTLQTSRPLH